MMHERWMYEPIARLFRSLGYTVLVDSYRVFFWLGSRPDIVAVKGSEVVVVEAKRKLVINRRLMYQLFRYANFADRVYIAVPRNYSLDPWKLIPLVFKGFGLIRVDREAEIVIEAKKIGPQVEALKKVLVRVVKER